MNPVSSERAAKRKIPELACLLALVLACAGLAACATPGGPQTQEGAQSGYHGVLASEYQSLADKAFSEFDWVDSYRFKRKAELARGGGAVAPDSPETRRGGLAQTQEIVRAQAALKGYLEPGRLSVAPEEIARAQAAFDCWLEEGEESGRALKKGACRESFYRAIKAADDKIIDDALDTIEAPTVAPKAPSADPAKAARKTPDWKRPSL